MGQGKHQDQVQRHIAQHGEHPDPHRRPGVLSREKGCGQHLDQDDGRQARHVRHQAAGRHLRVVAGELIVLKQSGEQRPCQQQQAQGRRQGDQAHPAQGPVQGLVEGRSVSVGVLGRQMGQDDRGQGDPEDPQGKPEQPVGEIQPGNAAGLQERGDDGVNQQVDLGDGDGEQSGDHQGDDPVHAFPIPAQAGQRQELEPQQEGNLKNQLDEAGEQHPPGQGRHPFFRRKPGRQPNSAGDDGQVEQHGGEGRHGELPVGVEDAPGQGRE